MIKLNDGIDLNNVSVVVDIAIEAYIRVNKLKKYSKGDIRRWVPNTNYLSSDIFLISTKLKTAKDMNGIDINAVPKYATYNVDTLSSKSITISEASGMVVALRNHMCFINRYLISDIDMFSIVDDKDMLLALSNMSDSDNYVIEKIIKDNEDILDFSVSNSARAAMKGMFNVYDNTSSEKKEIITSFLDRLRESVIITEELRDEVESPISNVSQDILYDVSTYTVVNNVIFRD